MKLNELRPARGSRKDRKRVGRGDGSGQGGTAGKGHKGQNARAGAKIKPGFEGGQMPLTRRLPKRGFRNFFRKEIIAVNIDQLKGFSAGELIDTDALINRGIVKKSGDGIKILGRGDIAHPLKIKVNMISRSAKEKIEAAGGSVEVI